MGFCIYSKAVYLMKLDELLKAIRKELDISQEAFAHDIHVSFTTMNRWENGRTKPSRLAIVSIRDYCKEKGISGELSSELAKLK
jgi:DNA-binding XRE family transcriptional regulator